MGSMNDQKRYNRIWGIIIPVLLLLLNFILKYIGISSNNISVDEPFSIYISQFDTSSILRILGQGNNPPLFELMLHYWTGITGIDAISVRFPSVLFSSLAVVFIYLSGKNNFKPATGLLAAILFSASTLQMYISHEARVYALFSLAFSATLYFYLEVFRKGKSRDDLIGLIIFGSLGMYSHYFGVIPVALIGASLMLRNVRKKAGSSILIALAVMIALYVPQMAAFFQRFSFTANEGTWVNFHDWRWIYGMLIRFFNSKFALLFLLIITFYIIKLLSREKRLNIVARGFIKPGPSLIVLLWFAIPYLTMYFISFRVPMFLDRYMAFCSIPLYIFLAHIFLGATSNQKFNYLAAVVFTTSMLMNFSFVPVNDHRPEEIARNIRSMRSEGDVVIVSPDYAMLEFAYYAYPEHFASQAKPKCSSEWESRVGLLHELEKENVFMANSILDTTIFSHKPSKVWYLRAKTMDYFDSDNRFLQYIENHYSKFRITEPDGFFVMYEFDTKVNK
ncbi:MAG: glycosyltransferase family 39 protein [Bacteroidetes bacterium]|nr:glycosyltransferase family 39 protein [Bacteroidota bacterium]